MVTHLAIISEGEIMFQGTKADLQANYGFNKVEFTLDRASAFISFIDKKYNPVLINETTLTVDTSHSPDIAAINRTLVENGAPVYRVAPAEGFEKWFMEITKKN